MALDDRICGGRVDRRWQRLRFGVLRDVRAAVVGLGLRVQAGHRVHGFISPMTFPMCIAGAAAAGRASSGAVVCRVGGCHLHLELLPAVRSSGGTTDALFPQTTNYLMEQQNAW